MNAPLLAYCCCVGYCMQTVHIEVSSTLDYAFLTAIQKICCMFCQYINTSVLFVLFLIFIKS